MLTNCIYLINMITNCVNGKHCIWVKLIDGTNVYFNTNELNYICNYLHPGELTTQMLIRTGVYDSK